MTPEQFVHLAPRSIRTTLTADRVVEAIKEIAFGGGKIAIRLKALELLAKHLGLFDDKKEVPIGGNSVSC